ncbi:MAG: HAD family hydrolase, partial [Anaerolineales bacterium]
MSLTLLIDLDDTLISNQMDTFVPVYLDTLGKHLTNHGDPELLISEFLAAFKSMMRNTRPDFTLKDTFDQNYYPQTGINYETLHPIIDDYFENHFSLLKYLTKPRKDAVALVQEAIKRKYRIVIATNPIFPKSAIKHRLNWGNLPLNDYEFSIITTYENFHYTKPNPAYFAEILAQMGWIDEPAVMIGNDIKADIKPARAMGLPTYWVKNDNDYTEFTPDETLSNTYGGLDTIMDWIDSQSPEQLQPNFGTPKAVTAILYSTPAALDTLTRGFTDKEWKTHNNDNEWGSTEILCHLRDVDQEIYLPRIISILIEDNPFIEAVDADQWAEER